MGYGAAVLEGETGMGRQEAALWAVESEPLGGLVVPSMCTGGAFAHVCAHSGVCTHSGVCAHSTVCAPTWVCVHRLRCVRILGCGCAQFWVCLLKVQRILSVTPGTQPSPLEGPGNSQKNGWFRAGRGKHKMSMDHLVMTGRKEVLTVRWGATETQGSLSDEAPAGQSAE